MVDGKKHKLKTNLTCETASIPAIENTNAKRHLGRRFNGRSILEQKFDDLDAILLAGNVQRREAVLRANNKYNQTLNTSKISSQGHTWQRKAWKEFYPRFDLANVRATIN